MEEKNNSNQEEEFTGIKRLGNFFTFLAIILLIAGIVFFMKHLGGQSYDYYDGEFLSTSIISFASSVFLFFLAKFIQLVRAIYFKLKEIEINTRKQAE